MEVLEYEPTPDASVTALRRASGKNGTFRGLWKRSALKARLDIEFRGARVYITGRAKTENGNPGLVLFTLQLWSFDPVTAHRGFAGAHSLSSKRTLLVWHEGFLYPAESWKTVRRLVGAMVRRIEALPVAAG